MTSLKNWLATIPPARTAASVVASVALVAAAIMFAPAGRTAPKLPDFGVLHNDVTQPETGPRRLVAAGDAGVAERLAATPGVTDVRHLDGFVTFETAMDDHQLLAATGVAAEPDAIVSLETLGVTDPYAEWQWPLHNWGQTVQDVTGTVDADIDAAAAFRASFDGAGVVVAVIDSGVDHTHPELAGARWRNTGEVCGNGVDDDANGYVDDCWGWDVVNGDNTPYDGSGSYFHGTHVASTIAAAHNDGGMVGVAPGVKIMDVKVTNNSSFFASNAAAAVRYAVDNGADIINASWSTTTASAPLADAISYAEAHGVLVVAAAGNRGADLDTSPAYPAAYANANVLAVAATTANDTLLASSSFGRHTVDVAAPGQNVIGAMPGGGHAYASGTSMAVPHVAGLAALTAQNGVSSPTLMISTITSSVDELGALSDKVVTGGRVNVAAALGLPDPDVEAPAPGGGSGDAQVAFTGFGALTDAEPLSGVVSFTPPSATPPGPYRLEGQLISVDPYAAAIQGLPLYSSGELTVTDAAGMWDLVETREPDQYQGRLDVAVAAALPAGRYALVVSMVSAEDPLELYGEQQAVIFDVSEHPTEPPAELPPEPPEPPVVPPSEPNTPGEPPVTPPTTVPDSGSPSDPGGSPTTTTSVPSAGGSPTTTAPDGGDGTGPEPPVTAPTSAPATTAAPTTTAPTTTVAPPTTAPTTTVPAAAPTTTAPSGPPTTVAPPVVPPGDPVADGEWALHSINPNVCATRTNCDVVLYGSFPHAPNVWFGQVVVPAGSVSYSKTSLRVTVPKTVTTGTVDVALRDHDVHLVMEDAFTFYDPDGSDGPGGSDDPPPGGGPGGGGSSPSTTVPPAGGPGGGGSPSTTAPSTTTTTVPEAKTWRRSTVVLGASTQRGTLTVAPITSGNPLRSIDVAGRVCRASSCGGVRL